MKLDLVIVTYNRLEKLKKALQCYERQTKTFRNLIVVNNHSNDGTKDFLEEWELINSPFSKHVINTDENLGGSGGFYIGQKYAMTLNPDWIYLADDDAYAEPDMIETFYGFCETNEIDKVSAICGTVRNLNGEIALQHRCTFELINKSIYKRINSVNEDYQKESFQIDLLSYVCAFINVKALKKCGLVNPKYFIYFDDTEHSIRLKKYGIIICVSNIKIIHEEIPNKDGCDELWKKYYIIRNHCHMLRKHFFRAAIDRTIYMLKQSKNVKYCDNMNRKIIRTAIFDAWCGRLGRHKTYKPGWIPQRG